ncbi:S8 family serine peptidase [Streptomyces monomycini]|uniref:S8 family serine peptidase n=1 Tax=Streptomyces monomycini TaxID=371720 RepID=UPI0004AB470B|nr:S8 family serine peptidase [Streptomyces monomycini]
MKVTRTLRAAAGAALTGALLLTATGTASADQTRSAQWPFEAFDAQSIWKEATGKGVTVAVVDTGFRKTHQDLAGAFLPGEDFPNPSIDKGRTEEPGSDIRDHGTGMSALIAGRGHGPGGSQGVKGLAPDAKILPLTADKNFPAAIRYAVEHDAKVINLSFIGDANTPDMCASIHYAVEKGVVVLAGVGNDGLSEALFPAACPGAIGVGAVDEFGKAWEGGNYNKTVDVLAPGVKIPYPNGQSDTGYFTGDGTSAATAYASATAALLLEKYPDLTPGQIANRMVKTAGLAKSVKAKNLKLPDVHYGYGFIQPWAALTRDIPAGPPEGPLPMPQGKASKDPVVAGAAKGKDPNPPIGGKKMLQYGGMAVGGLLVIGLVVMVIVLVRRRNKPGPQAWS